VVEMQIDDKLIEGLTRIGLQKYQAQVYIASVVLGDASAYLIAKESNVPRSKVYEVLDSLVELGFMSKVPSDKGMLFKALPPENTIDNAITNIVNTIDNVKKEIKVLQKDQLGKSSEPAIVIFSNTSSLLEMIQKGEFYESWIDNSLEIAMDLRKILSKKKCEIHTISSVAPLSFILGSTDSYFIRGINGSLFMIKFSNNIMQQILGMVEKTKPETKEVISKESGVRIIRETAIISLIDKIKLVIPGYDWKTEKVLFWGTAENISGAFSSKTPCDCFITETRLLISADDGRVWARAIKFIQSMSLKDSTLKITFGKVGGTEVLTIRSIPYAIIIDNLLHFILKKK
jgi:predicted transcriptional regulator